MSQPPPNPNKDKVAKIRKAFNSVTAEVCRSNLAIDAEITNINRWVDM